MKVSFTKELSLNFTVKRCGEADLNAYKRSLNWQPFMKRVYEIRLNMYKFTTKSDSQRVAK